MEKSTNSRGWMREGFAGYSSCKLFPKGRKPKEDIKWRARVKMEVSERRFKNLELKCTAFPLSLSLSFSWIQFSLIPVANRDPPTPPWGCCLFLRTSTHHFSLENDGVEKEILVKRPHSVSFLFNADSSRLSFRCQC